MVVTHDFPPAGSANYMTVQAAFAAINAGTHRGAITITLYCSTTEPLGGAILNASGTGPFPSYYTSVTMSPAGGARMVSGAIMPGRPLIDLNGADNVMINGLSPNEGSLLTLSNTTASATAGTSTIRFINDATNNTVTNCKIRGSSITPSGAAGGTVLFSTGAAAGTGNDGNTISFCDIGPADPLRLPSYAIQGLGSTTSDGIRNSEVLIDGNHIFDFFGTGAGAASGVHVLSGNHNWTISNNRIYQTNLRTFSATAVRRYAPITLNTTTRPGVFTVTGNIIGFRDANGTGTTTINGSLNEFRGINARRVDSSIATSIQGNTISNINQTTSATSRAFIGISLGDAVPGSVPAGVPRGLFDVGTTSPNTIGSVDGPPSNLGVMVTETSARASVSSIIGIGDFSLGNDSIFKNLIGKIRIDSGGTGRTAGFRGIYVLGQSGQNMTINENVIGGMEDGSITDNIVGNYNMVGIQSSGANVSASRNTIRNMRGDSRRADRVAVAGILCTLGNGSNSISRNTIHSLDNAAGTVRSFVYGMGLRFSVGGPPTANIVEQNFVHSLSITSTATAPTGRLVGIGGTGGNAGNATYQNNMVRLGINAAGEATPGLEMFGFVERPGSNNFYHNSVYLGGAVAGVASDTFAFFSSNAVTSGTHNYKNNIFQNNRTSTALNLACHFSGGIPVGPPGLVSNGNVYYRPNASLVIQRGTATPRTLSQWRSLSGQDLDSFGLSDPQFKVPDGTATTVDLHLMGPPGPLVPTVCEQHGVAGTGVTDDFDGQSRALLTPIDIGADAGDFEMCPGCQ